AELLDAASALVRPGGVLVYSTCSIEDDENEQQSTSFLQRHPEFELEPITADELQRRESMPAQASADTPQLLTIDWSSELSLTEEWEEEEQPADQQQGGKAAKQAGRQRRGKGQGRGQGKTGSSGFSGSLRQGHAGDSNA
ncbi:SAM_MT_RSMB_NOP domain-containing protein, partial [Haematococcus lacustris]